MEYLKPKKANFYFGVGSLFMTLVVVFVGISLTAPDIADQITNALSNLFGSVRG